VEAIAELQSQGYSIPNYNPNPTTEEETDAKYKAFISFIFSSFSPKSRREKLYVKILTGCLYVQTERWRI
jgi:monomeric isocitrate dehydrogenase